MDSSIMITRVVGWAAGVFQTIEQTGDSIPDGPVLVVANHPNSLLDPLVIFHVAGRPTRPLAKAPLFEQRFVGTLLRGLGGLPVYRAVDDAAQMHRNDETFRGAIAALHRGDAIQIYPEGKSHSEPALAPLRTGAARIALGAESQHAWTLGLKIVPVGLTFDRKSRFRSRVLATIGEPFTVTDLRDLHDADSVAAVRALTQRIADSLAAVTLNLQEAHDAQLIDTAERLYTREKRATGWRERDTLAERVPRLQAFARGLSSLRSHDPARHQRLARAVERYRRRASLLGSHDGDVPPRYDAVDATRYALVEGLALLLLAPLGLIGTLIWLPTWLAPQLTLRLVRPDYEAVATYKLATGFLMVPVTVLAGIGIGALLAGVTGVLAAAVLVPASGFAALAWHERWQRVSEDALLYLRVLLRRESRDRLARDRAALVSEFDSLMAAGADPGAAGPAATIPAPAPAPPGQPAA
jgi:glycerol-3-phosphate O-acyltransferase / dihydroxyacetone phosphate acyltransferase